MFANFQLVIYLTTIMLMLFWALKYDSIRSKAWVLIVGSLLILATLSIESLLVALFSVIQALLMIKVQANIKSFRHIAFSCLIFLPLLAFSILQQIDGFTLQLLGLSFFTLKLYSLIRDSQRFEESASVTSILFYIFFFPVFSAGPIENYKSLNVSILNSKFDVNDFLYGLYRSLLGLFKVGFIADQLISPLVKSYTTLGTTSLDSWTLTVLSFSYLYINFSGFSDIAIGFSRLFGIKIRENFNYPIKATNIQEFWQRWHMSLGAWVTQYLYFPMVRAKGKPLLSLFIVFVFMGAWHSLNPNYLIWGIAHGAAMIFVAYIPKKIASKNSAYAAIREYKSYKFIGGVITLTYVAVLSKFANSSSLEAGLNYLGSLI